MNKGEQENLFWADLLRAVVVFGVILVHVAADVITEWSTFPKSWWWAANIYDSLIRGPVPVFVMLSGALLLPKRESCKDFFRKRFNRIAIPSVAWIVLFLLWKKHFYKPDLGFAEALRWVAGDTVHFHLWFLYLIIGLYLVTPIFRILIAQAKKRDIFYFLMLWFFVSSLLPFAEALGEMFTHANVHIKIPVEPASGFIGYFVLGYFLNRYVTKKSIFNAWAVWIVGLAVCLFGTYFLSLHFHSFQMLLYGNMSPNVIFYTASFFIVVKYAGPVLERHMNHGLKNLIVNLSKASFGIYLIHPMILDALGKGRWGFVLKADMSHPIYMIPLTAVVIYSLSFLAIFVIQKIPYLRKIA